MKIYLNENVFDAALDRVRWLFDEFDEVVVEVSGGKDSTCVFELCKIVAREKNRLPLKVMWLDQEAEWQATVDVVQTYMEDPEVDPYWYQVPFKLFNATGSKESWLQCWDPKEEHRWMRPRWDRAKTVNNYGVDRFTEIFEQILRQDFSADRACFIAGVRAEESPSRKMAMTMYETYGGETWGRKYKGGNHFVMYPIWNWSYKDVWAAIHKNDWLYNKIYDLQYAYGIPVRDMRVSNVHHETAVMHLFYMQEAEPETYERLTQRIGGIDTAGKMSFEDYFPKELPYMFKDWLEYRDYLLEKLIDNPDWRARFKKNFAAMDKFLPYLHEKIFKVQITSIMTNDWEGIKTKNFVASPKVAALWKSIRAGEDIPIPKEGLKYVR